MTGLSEPSLDRPDVVASVREVFDTYEHALAAGDVELLTQLFWDDPRTVRFGVTDRQHGAAEIATWRAAHPSVPPGRRLSGTTVLALDDRTAVVCTLFGYPGRPVEGRQTQVWARFAEGWRIVSAHVSEVPVPNCARTGPAGDSSTDADPGRPQLSSATS